MLELVVKLMHTQTFQLDMACTRPSPPPREASGNSVSYRSRAHARRASERATLDYF
jgi:hypothetical protein